MINISDCYSPSALATRLRYCSISRHPNLPGTPIAVGAQRCGTTHLPLATARSCVATLHWLRVPERVQYKIAVLTYEVLHDSAPRYLGPLVAVADLPGRRALRSASTSRLVIPPIKKHQTVYCWQPCLSGCCSSSLERSARGHHLIVITADFPALTKDLSFSNDVSTRPHLIKTACLALASLQILKICLFPYILCFTDSFYVNWHRAVREVNKVVLFDCVTISTKKIHDYDVY